MTTSLAEYLSYYSKLEEPGYAVLVTGEWGTGKTYQVKKCIPEDQRLYVSLYGIDTVEQLHSEVFAAAMPMQAKFEEVAEKGGEVIANAGGLLALAGGLPSLFNAAFRRDLEPSKILIFDDLERCSIRNEDILGAINSYVEQRGFRVVVISHDKKIVDQIREMKEKVFGHTIQIVPQTENALDHFLDEVEGCEAVDFIREHRAEVLDIYQSSKEKSLRVLRHVVMDLSRLHGCMASDHLGNREAMSELVQTFVAFAIETRTGKLAESDLENRKNVSFGHSVRVHAVPDKVKEKPALMKANEKYTSIDLEAGMLNDDVLIEMLIKGQFSEEQIQQSINNSAHFIKPEETPPWKTIFHFNELDDNLVTEAVRKMETQFENREVTVPGEILHICSLRLMLAVNKVLDKSISQIEGECTDYIDEVAESGKMPPRGTEWHENREFGSSHDGYSYWVGEEVKEHFQRIMKHIINVQEEAFTRKLPELQGDLLLKVRENPESFFEAVSHTNNGPNPYAEVPVLKGIEVSEFTDAWLESGIKNWRFIKYALENRYRGNRVENEMKEEKEWILQVLSELDHRTKKETGFKHLRMKAIRPSFPFEPETKKAQD